MPTDGLVGRSVASGDLAPHRRGRRLALSEKVAALGLLTVVFVAVLAFGASQVATATLFSGLYAAFLLTLLVTCDWARRDLAKMSGLGLQATLFAVLIVAVIWPLSPWGPGGPHPVWTYLPGTTGSMTIDRSALLLNVLQLFGLASLFVSARIVGTSETRGLWFLKAAVVAIGLYAGLALVDHVAARRSARLAATLLSPNSAATTFGAGLLLAVAAAVSRFRRYPGMVLLRCGDPEAAAWLAIGALLVTVLFLTASRAGVVATLLGLGSFIVWNIFAQRQTLRGAALMATLAAILLVAAIGLRSSDTLTDRFSLIGRDAEIRSMIYAPNWAAFLSTPWSGFGLGSFPTVNQMVFTQSALKAVHDVRAAHNLYLQWLEEGGMVGAVAMLAMFCGLIWPIARGSFKDGSAGIWARATVCAAVVFLLHGMTDFALQVPAVQALCALILGVVGAMALKTKGSVQSAKALSPWATGAMAGVTLAATVLAAGPMFAAKLGGDLSAWPTAPADALASAVEAGLAGSTRDRSNLERLERISARELALRPASGAAWLRRAAVEAELGHVEASGLALERSFKVAPLQTSLFERRTIFAYEHWDKLSQSAREQAAYQFKAEYRRTQQPARFIAMANNLRNPAGRVGMALQIAVLRLAARAE